MKKIYKSPTTSVRYIVPSQLLSGSPQLTEEYLYDETQVGVKQSHGWFEEI